MATKTITLELDAYEKLRAYYRSGGAGVSESYLDSVEAAVKHDPAPDSPWA